MKKSSFLVTAFLFLVSIVQAQGYTQQITNVKTQARIMAEAAMKRDYTTLLKYINIDGFPKGRLNIMTKAKALKIIQTADSQMVKQGIAIQSINFGDVLSILKVGFEFQCTMPQTTEMKMQVGRVITTSTLIGLSEDNGINWTFIDATGRDKIEMKRLMPKLSSKLQFAKQESPKFISHQ
ncbi:hypothetical protein [Parasediminibacterium sp. JCM 36343]|uniref:hypothetical protein n=1 Tax=Parasediminibacterium sp. JCM 36343 TaxID=3374279 RepID=UPI0039798B53